MVYACYYPKTHIPLQRETIRVGASRWGFVLGLAPNESDLRCRYQQYWGSRWPCTFHVACVNFIALGGQRKRNSRWNKIWALVYPHKHYGKTTEMSTCLISWIHAINQVLVSHLFISQDLDLPRQFPMCNLFLNCRNRL